MDGGELARSAGVAASTATEHINQLITGGVLTEHRQGRHRYVRLAGAGIDVSTGMIGRGLLSTEYGFTVTGDGVTWLSGLGIDVDALRRAGRPFVRNCLDWTERLSHVAGGVGAALCRHFFDAGWVVRTGAGRAVRLTGPGRAALHDELGI